MLCFNLSYSFSAMGKMGKLYLLSSDEILAQLFYAKKIEVVLPPVSNIVFMGMGEPSRVFFTSLLYK